MATAIKSKTVLKKGIFKLGYNKLNETVEYWNHKQVYYKLSKNGKRVSSSTINVFDLLDEISMNKESLYVESQFKSLYGGNLN